MRSALVVVLLLATAPVAGAQSPPGTPAPDSGRPDFFFGRPEGSLTLRGSWLIRTPGGGDGDIFAFVERELTVEREQFNTASLAGDIGFALTPRADLVIGLDYNRASIDSEYRRFVDSNRLPIEQTTALSELNVSGGIRFALAPRGREVSRFAWIPSRVVPYVGVGGGMLWYQFRQAGDFIDALDPRLPVFTDTLEGSGWTPSAHVAGGVDVQVHRRWYLTLDGRYLWAAGDLGQDFVGFDPIDLAGFRFGAGVHLVF
jgi:hypothetical protein